MIDHKGFRLNLLDIVCNCVEFEALCCPIHRSPDREWNYFGERGQAGLQYKD